MKQEIERKFLVRNESWRTAVTQATRLRQGYLCLEPSRTVRVRISGTQGWLTIKGAGEGSSRAEFEYPLPLNDATDLLDHLCMRPQIDKTRHLIPHGGLTFEVDVFHGENEGLVMAEVELSAVDTHVDLPPWIGAEVTGDHRYFNAYLAQHPFRSWSSHGL